MTSTDAWHYALTAFLILFGLGLAFALFRLAAICQGIMGRVRDGTASDPDARRRGERARPLAEAGWAVVDRAA